MIAIHANIVIYPLYSLESKFKLAHVENMSSRDKVLKKVFPDFGKTFFIAQVLSD